MTCITEDGRILLTDISDSRGSKFYECMTFTWPPKANTANHIFNDLLSLDRIHLTPFQLLKQYVYYELYFPTADRLPFSDATHGPHNRLIGHGNGLRPSATSGYDVILSLGIFCHAIELLMLMTYLLRCALEESSPLLYAPTVPNPSLSQLFIEYSDTRMSSETRTESNVSRIETPTPSAACVDHVLLTADAALQHIVKHRERIDDALLRHNIPKIDYHIQVGFSEPLLKRDVGYLQEIYTFLRVEPPSITGLLTGLGEIFTPFPGVIITPFSSHRTPVLNDGTPFDRDTIVLDRTERYSNGALPSLTVMQNSWMVPRYSSGENTPQGSGGSSGGGDDKTNDNDRNNRGEEGSGKGNDKSGNDHNNRMPDEDDHKQDNVGSTKAGRRPTSRSQPEAMFDFQVQLSNGPSSSRIYQNLSLKGAVTLRKVNMSNLIEQYFQSLTFEFRRMFLFQERTRSSTLHHTSILQS